MTGYTRIADSFHRRIEAIAGAVDVMAPGIENAARLLTRAALEDRRIFVSGAGSDAALAEFLARSLREGDEAGPPLPALAVSCSGTPEAGLWRDLRALARRVLGPEGTAAAFTEVTEACRRRTRAFYARHVLQGG